MIHDDDVINFLGGDPNPGFEMPRDPVTSSGPGPTAGATFYRSQGGSDIALDFGGDRHTKSIRQKKLTATLGTGNTREADERLAVPASIVGDSYVYEKDGQVGWATRSNSSISTSLNNRQRRADSADDSPYDTPATYVTYDDGTADAQSRNSKGAYTSTAIRDRNQEARLDSRIPAGPTHSHQQGYPLLGRNLLSASEQTAHLSSYQSQSQAPTVATGAIQTHSDIVLESRDIFRPKPTNDNVQGRTMISSSESLPTPRHLVQQSQLKDQPAVQGSVRAAFVDNTVERDPDLQAGFPPSSYRIPQSQSSSFQRSLRGSTSQANFNSSSTSSNVGEQSYTKMEEGRRGITTHPTTTHEAKKEPRVSVEQEARMMPIQAKHLDSAPLQDPAQVAGSTLGKSAAIALLEALGAASLPHISKEAVTLASVLASLLVCLVFSIM